MADTPAYLSRDYVRLWDLVRQMRSELLGANLITMEEYAALLAEETADRPGQGSPSPRRLESYDEMRQSLELHRKVSREVVRCPRCESCRDVARDMLREEGTRG